MKRLAPLTGTLLLTGTTLAAPVASAHDYPVGTSPKTSQTLAHQPGHVSVTFDDFVLSKPAPPDLVVVGPDGHHYETACATVTNRTVSVPTQLGSDGKYTATWRVVSADGHPVSDSVSFTFKATPDTQRASGRTSGSQCASSDHQTASSTESTSARGPLIAAGLAGVGAICGITSILLRARRRPDRHIEEDDD